MDRNSPTEWTRGLEGEEKKNFDALINANKHILRKIYQVLKSKMNMIDREELSINDFDNNNWAYRQAFRNGKRTSFKELLDLLEFANA